MIERDARYRPDIDGLRAIAVLAVIGFHSGLHSLRNGFAGVDIFFVISGYLITGIIVGALEKGTFSYREFYVRRINRIVPALIIVLSATAAVGWFVLYDYEMAALGRHIIGGATFVANFVLWKETGYFELPLKPLLHLWSLAVEEQFYLLWPLMTVIAWRPSPRRLLLVICGIIAVSLTIGLLEIQKGQASAAFYLPFGRFWEILSGALLLVITREDTAGKRVLEIDSRAHDIIAIAGAALLLTSLALTVPDGAWPGWLVLVPVAGTLFLLTSPHAWINQRVLSLRPLVAIGLISYPLYLSHWPILTFGRIVMSGFMPPAQAALAVAISFLLSVLTYRYVEIPIRFGARKRRSAFRLLVGLALTGVLGVLMKTGVTGTRSNGGPFALKQWGPEWVAPINILLQHGTRVLLFSQPGDTSRSVFFFGDSHANHYWARVLALAAESRGDFPTVSILAFGGCLMLPGIDRRGIDWEGKPWECDRLYQAALAHARDPKVKTVVISEWWELYTRHGMEYLVSDSSSGPLTEGDPRLDRVFEQFERDIASIVALGKRVYLILPSPNPGKQMAAARLPRRLMSFAPQNRGINLSRAVFESQTRWVTAKLRDVAGKSGAKVIDPAQFLCNATICPTVMPDGLPIYWDDDHLRAAYVARYAVFLDQVFK